MDRDQLAAFDHIAREGSFTRAALSLGIGQPAVSARIRALEEQIGGTLFTRGRRIALTALGESFLPFARRALELLGEGIEAARVAQDDLVRLGRPLFRLRWWQAHHPTILGLAERAGPAVELPMEAGRCLAL